MKIMQSLYLWVLIVNYILSLTKSGLWYYCRMKRLFNKSFFKFTAGFAGIIAMAMLSVLVISAYEVNGKSSTSIENEQAVAE